MASIQKTIQYLARPTKGGLETSANGWHIENGQVFYDGNDLQFPAGQIQEVMTKLVEAEGKTIPYDVLEEISTRDKIRHHIAEIRKLIKGTPYIIKTLAGDGYKLHLRSES